MKKMLCLISVLICSLLSEISAKADVIWVPENSFYEENHQDCEYVERNFLANGPDGEVILYRSPESSEIMETWENGHTAHISYTYRDNEGVVWGLSENSERKGGWVPMEYMEVIYDAISFTEEYGTEFMEESGFLGEDYIGESIYIWEYPGSEKCFPVEITKEMNLPEYYKVYVDDDGRKWGYLGYYYGFDDAWICVDAPKEDADRLYPDGVPKHETKPQKDNQSKEKIVPKPDVSRILFAAVSAGILVLVTIVLLVLLKKRIVRREEKEKDCRN